MFGWAAALESRGVVPDPAELLSHRGHGEHGVHRERDFSVSLCSPWLCVLSVNQHGLVPHGELADPDSGGAARRTFPPSTTGRPPRPARSPRRRTSCGRCSEFHSPRSLEPTPQPGPLDQIPALPHPAQTLVAAGLVRAGNRKVARFLPLRRAVRTPCAHGGSHSI